MEHCLHTLDYEGDLQKAKCCYCGKQEWRSTWVYKKQEGHGKHSPKEYIKNTAPFKLEGQECPKRPGGC